MQKRKLNTSRYDYKSKKLMWRVVWNLSRLTSYDNEVSDGVNKGNEVKEVIECIDARVDDESIVAAILEPHIKQNAREDGDEQSEEATMAHIAVVLRKEGSPANKPEYYRINTASSLKDALAGKTIIEYPEFLCIPLDYLEQYPICM
jgi:hypothetical protein